MDSFDELSKYVMEILEMVSCPEEIESRIELAAVTARMRKIDALFNEILSLSRQLDYIIVSKLDDIEFEVDLSKLRRNIGKLGIVMEFLLIPHLDNSLQQKQYWEMRYLCKIRNIQLTALIMTIQARKEFRIELARDLYFNARKNYVRAQEFAQDVVKNQNLPDFEEERILSQAAERMCTLFENFLTANPAYFADELEQVEALLLNFNDSRALMLKKQIMKFYNLGTEIMFILEELRNQKPLEVMQAREERVLYYTGEIRDTIKTAKNWINSFESKYSATQKQLLALHCGQMMPYLEDYRKEFQTRVEDAIHRFNDLLSQYVAATTSDYALETAELFELLDAFMDNEEFVIPDLVAKFEHYYHELLILNETVRQFLLDILGQALKESLMELHSLDMVTAVSEKNALFDKKVLRFINLMVERFIDLRNHKLLPLEQQRSIFNIEYRPAIEKVIQKTFTLSIQDVPFPIFLEFILLEKALDVDHEYRAILLLENPSPITLQQVGVTFFVPNSFNIQTRIINIGKMRPNEKLRVDTIFVPTQEGRFYLMAMVQYEHVKESFWMPSVKIPIVVGNPPPEDEILHAVYRKHGINPEDVEFAKQGQFSEQEQEEEEEEDEEPVDIETVERVNLANLLKGFEIFDEDQLDEEAPDSEKSNKD
jgi:hypothetical protein